MHKGIIEEYQKSAGKFNLLCLKHKKIMFSLSMLRLVVFACGAGLAVFCFSVSSFAGISSIVTAFVIFLYLVLRYERHSERKEFFSNLETINNNEVKAITGDLSPFVAGSNWINRDHDFSNDVDLFGSNSLFHFLNRTVTGQGRAVLAGWLSEPFNLSGEIRQRQEAIAELSGKLVWRQEFIAYGTGKSLEKEDIEGVMNWLNDESQFLSSTFWKTAIWFFPLLTLGSLTFLIAGFIPYTVFILFFLTNLLLTLGKIRYTAKIHVQVSRKHAYLSSLNKLLLSFEKEPFDSVILKDIRNNISKGEASAVKGIKSLSRIIELFDSRLNFMVGFILNGMFLWDFHCIRYLEKWKVGSGHHFPLWLDEIGKVDALISLSNYAFNNPGYAFPSVSDTEEIFIATDLGHPLIESSLRICNDFALEKAGKVIIITGANMAGKSTFLRTLAVNLILAMTGAPVCAIKLKFTPLKLFTSMRTTDSLTNNESYFYAELKRLKSLKIRLEQGEKILFILDEILKGTNSADKSKGSRLYLKKVIELCGTGLIATHDTSLGDMENEYPGSIVNKCFEIEIDGEKISFDYKLREGITRKMNAALLMKQMGIA
jgi:hypothetical protein